VDAGGETNYGITRRVATANGYHGEMKNIPMSVVEGIYKKSYWDAAKCEQLPDHLRHIHFDTAVNMGVGTAAKLLQRASGVDDDGVIGSGTIAACQSISAKRYAKARMKYYVDIVKGKPEQIKFLAGWLNRLIDVSA
jgi:lysozyme family protein